MKLQRNGRSKALAIGAMALVSSLSLAACGSDNNTNTASGGSNGSSAAAAAINCGKAGTLLGAGSTAQAPAIDVWKTNFGSSCSGTTVNYSGGGSGAGVQQFNQGKVAFAGSDFALKPADVDASKAVCTGGKAIDLPMVAGLVSLVYNVEGVDNLVLDGPTAAKVFDSQITKWNDPAIAALNPGAKLPDAEIQTFHRSDDSGTTFNLTSYFAKTSGGAWSAEPSKAWKGKGGQSANGSAGVSAQIKQVKNSIGYAELSYAQTNNLKSAKIATGAAQPVEATAANAANTIASSTVSGTDGDLALSLDYGTKADNAYPIVLVTYEIACDKGNKAETLDTLKSFLTYTISDGAQKSIGDKGYVPMPAAIGDKVKAAVGTLA
ncbi:phosphate ABC transporter substrate-binding protein PstS [Kitasatospora aureofaciens]|uniref:Phosphate-binding protein n=1 Tax=Kitasatospora aureofaciens TaxID=1894 RepID=A0A1E7N781_KITAU|nr:phosphate ABC transporter substrate-binding protein PstS [Kitasatospora aureofaciens]QEV00403.1 phosphate ABC transporter substrate-binding protein PstS [Streptomyces viridifaciens]ARF79204.1 phosphate ABC transporter substrate-binding protein PstS [Kitasatospora aureofaciens]OEV36494.1 phosphate ABC transporter substrate-binding protein PstS [Kitasatospora aureofaciens]UKZ06639.1 phosphate ABC transporter substrate-binding protein PstS [Streptomyces viridifaciens]GGU81876.1 phosphate-bindi